EGGSSAGGVGGWGLATLGTSLRDLALFRLDRLLGLRIDPPAVDADAVFRRDLRPPELVPIGDPERRQVKIRDHVIAVLQYPIEGAGAGDEAGPVGRRDQLLDQFVDDRVLDAEQIAAA